MASAYISTIATKFAVLDDTFWRQNGDPRTESYWLMRSIRPILGILIAYLAFVLYLGPRFMRRREPYSLRPLLIVYNLTMSAWNAYFFYRVMFVDYNFGLAAFDLRYPSFDDRSPAMISRINIGHAYLCSKLIDLADTVFFVVRKKQKQITALHVFHHFSVPLFGWIHYRLCGTNVVVIPFGLLNSFVHTLMYAYYGLAAFGPHLAPYLWWKRYLTQLQIAQFVALFIYGIYFGIFQREYSPLFTYNMLMQSMLYMILFTQFYRKSYDAAAAAAAAKTETTTTKTLAENRQKSALKNEYKKD